MPEVPSAASESIVTDADAGAISVDSLHDVLGSSHFDPDGNTQQSSAPFPGELIGNRYRLEDKLAQGTFGLVFRAHDTELDRVVALKVLNPDHVNKREIVRRFLQEATAAARVVHPGVITILDCGQYNGGAYIAMDLLDGESLTERIELSGRLLAHDAVEIARQIAAGLEAAHAANVLHRDLKPDNIFLVADPVMPDGLRVKLIDFGLAKVDIDLPGPRRTRVHSVFGTPRYMSPEQCRSSTNIDHRSDIYALGCILFELLTGAPPYDGDIDAIIAAHLDAPIPRISTFCACTPQLDELLQHLLAKDPAHRFQSMTAVRRALDSIPLGRLGSSPTITPTSQRAAFPRIMRPGAASQEATEKKAPLDTAVRAPLDTTVDGVVGGVIEQVRTEPPRLARGTSAPPPFRHPAPPPIVKGRAAPRPTIAPPSRIPRLPPSQLPESARLPRVVVSDSAKLARIETTPPPPAVVEPAPLPHASNRMPRVATAMPITQQPPAFVPSAPSPTHGHAFVPSAPSPTHGHAFVPSAPSPTHGHAFVPSAPSPTHGHAFVPSAPSPTHGHKLPPYFPERPVLAGANVTPPTPVPMSPTMSTAMAMSMAYVPPPPNGKAPSLQHPIAIPMSLAAPGRSYDQLDAFEEPPPSRWPLVIVALACSLAGALAALVVA